MTKVDLTEAQRLAEATTPGPWTRAQPGSAYLKCPRCDQAEYVARAIRSMYGAEHHHVDADAAFVEWLSMNGAALIGELTEARQQLETAQQRAERLKMERDNLVKINAGLAAQLEAAEQQMIHADRADLRHALSEANVQRDRANQAQQRIDRVIAFRNDALDTSQSPWLGKEIVSALDEALALGAAVNDSSTEATQP